MPCRVNEWDTCSSAALTIASSVYLNVFSPDGSRAAQIKLGPFVTADGKGFVAAAGQDVFARRLQRELARRRAAQPAPARQVPCHHDLHHRNFLDDGPRLFAVDWEYAGPGKAPILNKEPLDFEYVHPSQRSYK